MLSFILLAKWRERGGVKVEMKRWRQRVRRSVMWRERVWKIRRKGVI